MALGVLFLFNSFMLSGRLVSRLQATFAGASDRMPVSPLLYEAISELGESWRGLTVEQLERQLEAPLRTELFLAPQAHDEEYWEDVETRTPSAAGEAYQRAILDRVRESGIDGFRDRPFGEPLIPDSDDWPRSAEDERELLGALHLLLMAVFGAILFTGLGAGNTDLGRVEWSLEWLFAFPVSGRAIFLARILERALIHPLAWFLLFPLASSIYVAAGFGWSGLALGAGASFGFTAMIASVHLLIETALRKHVRLIHIKNAQAGFTVLGLLLLYLGLYLGFARAVPEWFTNIVHSTPEALIWSPVGVALAPAARTMAVIPALGIFVASAVLAIWGGARALEYLVRDGLMVAGGAYQGTRQRTAKSARRESTRSRVLGGMLGKEFALLRRDRSFLVQTLFVPLLIIGFQFVINPRMLRAAAENPRHGAALAFGIGAYVLAFGAVSILFSEAKTLWLLCSFPRELHRILRDKAKMWAALSCAYVLAIVLGFALTGSRPALEFAGPALMALAGAFIYGFIASGLGVLGTHPLETENRQRAVRPTTVYLYMLLAALYGFGIYVPDLWPKLVLVVLCSLLAYAIWQKVRDLAPYLLDPVSPPPPRLSLSDALIAVLAFFVLQSLAGAIILYVNRAGEFSLRGVPSVDWASLTIAFVITGFAVTAFSLATAAIKRIPNFLETVGLRAVAGALGPARCALTGAALALPAIGVGAVYLLATEKLEIFQALREQMSEGTDWLQDTDLLWFWLLAVIAAPLFEEYIFRGLVFSSLIRSLPTWLSVLASAFLFAIVHPAGSALPVFVLGVCCAIGFSRSRSLLTPIVTHALYNGAVLALHVQLGR